MLFKVIEGAIHRPYHVKQFTVASPGFGARRGTCKSYWVLQEATVDIIIVADRLCIGQSALKS